MTTALQRTIVPSSIRTHSPIHVVFDVYPGLWINNLVASDVVAFPEVGREFELERRSFCCLFGESLHPFFFLNRWIAPVADGPGAGDDPKEPTLSAGSLVESHSSCSSLGSLKGRQQRVKMVEAQPSRVREMRMASPPGIPNRSRRWRFRSFGEH